MRGHPRGAMKFETAALAAGAIAWAFAACGYPDFQYGPIGAASSKASSAKASSSSAGVGGAGGMGEGGAKPCDPYAPTNPCGAGAKCTVVDVDTGRTGCGGAGPRQAFDLCNNDGDCAAKLWCDLTLGVCKPLCKTAGDCMYGPHAGCAVALQAGGKPVAGGKLQTCQPDCNPITGEPCAFDNHVTCALAMSTPNECVKSGGALPGSACVGNAGCAPKVVCLDPTNNYNPVLDTTSNGKCFTWCSDPNKTMSPDCNFTPCYPFNPPFMYNSKEYGTCGT